VPRAKGCPRLITMMARKRSPRLAGSSSREAAAKRIDFVGAATGAHPAHIGSYSLDPVVVARKVENFIGAAQGRSGSPTRCW
jgi:hydroxymethylglutaryl-CoA reductase